MIATLPLWRELLPRTVRNSRSFKVDAAHRSRPRTRRIDLFARKADRFEGRSSLYTWLYGILLNLVRRERRSYGVRRDKLRVLWDNESNRPKNIPAAETSIEVAEWKRSLWSYVARLPEGQRDALVLRFSEHLAYDEIAEVMGCPLGTVKSRIFHGLASLREMLSREEADVKNVPKFPFEDLANVI